MVTSKISYKSCWTSENPRSSWIIVSDSLGWRTKFSELRRGCLSSSTAVLIDGKISVQLRLSDTNTGQTFFVASGNFFEGRDVQSTVQLFVCPLRHRLCCYQLKFSNNNGVQWTLRIHCYWPHLTSQQSIWRWVCLDLFVCISIAIFLADIKLKRA